MFLGKTVRRATSLHLFVYSAIMLLMREAWTDERLDDLSERMDRGFDRVDRDIREVKGEIREVKGEVRDLRADMDRRFGRLESRFDSLQRMTLVGFLTLVGLILAHF